MGIDREFEQEWGEVKSELSKLKGCTVYTIPKNQPNTILEVREGGVRVRRRSSSTVSWKEIKNKYEQLWATGTLLPDQSKQNNGSFCRAVFAQLTTARVVQREDPPILRYAAVGRPPRLKDKNQLHREGLRTE